MDLELDKFNQNIVEINLILKCFEKNQNDDNYHSFNLLQLNIATTS